MKPAVLLAVLLVALLACAPARARGVPVSASGGANVVVLPDTVNRYETFILSVVAPPYTAFNLTAYGSNGFNLAWRNATDSGGTWRVQLSAWYDYGTYTFQLAAGNATSHTDLVVGCNARCQSDILRQNGVDAQALQLALMNQYGIYALLIVLACEIPWLVHYFSRAARDAKRRGQYTAKDSLYGFFSRLRAHINPGDQVADPQDVQNPRIAVDMERREIMEQLHDATSRRYMTWRPDHLVDLTELFHDLTSAWKRQASIQPAGEVYARQYLPEKVVPTTPTPAANVRATPTAPPVSMKERPKKALHAGHVAVYVIGALGGLMVALVLLAYAGIYVDTLRALWVPWPDDNAKEVLGTVALLVALGAWRYWSYAARNAGRSA